MDIQRPELARKNKRQRLLGKIATGVIIAGIASFFFLHKPGPIAVDQDLLFTAEVKRGVMEQKLRGTGELQPIDARWISARSAGRVERIHTLAGAAVSPDTLIVDLSNPELVQKKQNAELELNTVKANFRMAKARLDSNLLQSESALRRTESEFKQAELAAKIDKQLFDRGLEAKQNTLRSQLQYKQLQSQLSLEKRRYQIAKESLDAELNAERNRVAQAKAHFELLASQVEGLQVKAGVAGLLQKQDLKEGQRVVVGQSLAQVVNPKNLKAVVRVPENQAKQLTLGQPALVDVRNGKVTGKVTRIDPNVEAGTVAVDIAFTQPLPEGARPNSSIEATVQVERFDNVLHVTRPAFSKAQSKARLFRLSNDGEFAEQIDVRFGRTSINTIEIVEGLIPGDIIISSDVTEWAQQDRIRLN